MTPSPYRTTRTRAANGIVAGALTSGALAATLELLTSLDGQKGLEAFIRSLFVVYSGGLAVGGLVLIFLGLPIWAFCHRLGLRSWRIAVPLAALIGGGSMAAFLTFSGDPDAPFVTVFLMFAVLGAVVGFVAWRVAYSHAPDRPEEVF